METEIWKDIEGYEGKYQVSNLGNVKSLNYNNYGYEKLLSPFLNSGYLYVDLLINTKRRTFRVHRLVAEAFIPNSDNKPEVNHINEIKTNNRAENLEWVTRKENVNHGTCPERKRKSMINGKTSKRVLQYDLEGKFIQEWESVNEIGRNGFRATSISNCCLGKINTYKGFIWRHKN